MKIYKFKDTVDGNYAFIMAKSIEEATNTLKERTSIPFKFIKSARPEDLDRPIVLLNNILPF